MATHRISILGPNTALEAGVAYDLVGAYITATNEVGNQLSMVLADGGSDIGFYGDFEVPQNYVGSAAIIVKGILDGSPGSSDTLGFAVKGLAIADNEASDQAYSSEDTASATIGSSGGSYSDEDIYEDSITLSNFSFSVGDRALFYFYLDTSGTSYTGNFLLLDVMLEYADA